MFWTIVLSVLAGLIALAYYFSSYKFDYWKKQNVPHIKPTPFLGNYADFLLCRKNLGEMGQNICSLFPDEPYFGAYFGTEPTLVVQDPEYIKLVTTKDFYYFNGREVSNYFTKEVFSQNVFSSYGDHWKVVRQNLTPIFSSAKMKNMFPLIEICSRNFEQLLDEETSISKDVDVRLLMARFTMACISSCAFGVDSQTMNKDYKANPFVEAGNQVFDYSKRFFWKTQLRSIWPAIFYGLKRTTFPEKLITFFTEFMLSVFAARDYKPTNRNDFVDFILNFKAKSTIVGDSITNIKTGEGKKVSLPVTDDLLVAHCLIFFLAGYETSATTLNYTLYELAKSPESLKRVQMEVDEYLAKHGNKLEYDCVNVLPFTDACVDEALRMYPVLGVITREVVEDYTLPTGVLLKKGVRVHLPVYHLHHNPKFFPEPEVFRPERFLGEEKRNIIQHTYIPFGDGPRICIGMRFAKMQILAGLVTILKKYDLELSPGTPTKVEFLPTSIITQPSKPLKIRFTVRDGWENRTLVDARA